MGHDTQTVPGVKMQQLYRLYDADGTLLYIGISYSAISRYAQHKATQPWIGDVCRIDIETHDVSRAEILEIERRAIISEKPLHNRAHNTRPGAFRATDTFDHAWMRQFCGENYDIMQSAVGHFLQAYCDFRSPGDTDRSPQEIWTELLAASRYYDGHRCSRPMTDYFTLPYRRTSDGVCHYKCGHCGHSWTCWWA